MDFGVRVTRRLLHPPRHKAVFGMGQQKTRQGLIRRPIRQRAVKFCHHARGADGQFQRSAILVKAFAQTGFQLFFRNIPEAGGLRALVIILPQRPSIALAQPCPKRVDGNRPVQRKGRHFVCIHAIAQTVNQRAMRFQHQRHQCLLAFQRQRGFGP